MKKNGCLGVILVLILSIFLVNFVFALDLPPPPGSPIWDIEPNTVTNQNIRNNVDTSGLLKVN